MGELNESFDDYTEMGNNGYKINLKTPTRFIMLHSMIVI